MRSTRSTLFVLFLLCAIASPSFADSVSLTLNPVGGAVSGPAGSSVGWGFTLTNTANDFLVATDSDFCVGVIASPCTNSLGTYTDILGQQFLPVGPGSDTLTQAFVDGVSGIGSFLINSNATGSVSGEIVLFYDLYSVDPNSPSFNPDTDILSLGNLFTTDASVSVSSSSVATPEPTSVLLLASGLIGLLFAKKLWG